MHNGMCIPYHMSKVDIERNIGSVLTDAIVTTKKVQLGNCQ